MDTEETGCLRISTSYDIDFPVWILLQDGLHVPPFDKHSGGNKVFQNLGMVPQSWYEWVKLIPINHDVRLYYDKEINEVEIQEAVSTRLTSIISAVQSMGIDPTIAYGSNWIEERRQEYLQEELQHYEDAKKARLQYPNIDTKFGELCEPPQLYPDPAIQAQLQPLWAEYKFNSSKKHTDDCIINANNTWCLNIKLPVNEYCQVFLIDYPYEVELFVTPIFGLVAVPDKPVDYDLLKQRITNLINDNYTFIQE